MKVVPVPVLSDNYAYLLINESSKTAWAVDPAQADKVLAAAKEHCVQVTTVLTTHKHADHAGGNTTMAKRLGSGAEIIGGEVDDVQACTRTVKDGETLTFEDIQIQCLHTPGHTRGHICYYVTAANQQGCVFTGDCLFIGGAGRFFEGTGAEMHVSLYEKLSALPEDTLVYCGHEYTASNYRFAQSLEPHNAALAAASQAADATLQSGGHTVPSSIKQEKETNPFMRAHLASIKAAVGLPESASTQEALQRVRDTKDNA